MDGCQLRFTDIRADNLELFPANLFVLALPNGRAGEYVAAIEHHHGKAVIIDLSADYRFDKTWVYGQPERFKATIAGAKRIANPGSTPGFAGTGTSGGGWFQVRSFRHLWIQRSR
jgi:N-acetyl-gamma-glutamylphosphate reductase